MYTAKFVHNLIATETDSIVDVFQPFKVRAHIRAKLENSTPVTRKASLPVFMSVLFSAILFDVVSPVIA
eukprot:16445486-Heterocapsa_arctica.AAC.1